MLAALPLDLLHLVLGRLQTQDLNMLCCCRYTAAVARRLLLWQKLNDNPVLKELYIYTKYQVDNGREDYKQQTIDHIDTNQDHIRLSANQDEKSREGAIVTQMYKYTTKVLKVYSPKAKTLDTKYHATRNECMQIGLLNVPGISKRYISYKKKEQSLRLGISSLYFLANVPIVEFPFSDHELALYVHKKAPIWSFEFVNVSPVWSLEFVHVSKKNKTVVTGQFGKWEPTVEYRLDVAKKDVMGCVEWLPRLTYA